MGAFLVYSVVYCLSYYMGEICTVVFNKYVMRVNESYKYYENPLVYSSYHTVVVRLAVLPSVSDGRYIT